MQVLIVFSNRYHSFRLHELDAVAELENIEIRYTPDAYSNNSCFMFVTLPSRDDAIKLAKRSILIKEIILPWANASTFEDLLDKVKTMPHLHEPYRNTSFKFNIETLNFSYSKTKQVDIIQAFSFLPFTGPIDLKNPQCVFVYHEERDYVTKTPLRFFFGVLLATGLRNETINLFDLKKREYLGTTTMDPELSLIMANQALVTPGKFVLDPFVGTGSFLITCSHFGAFTVGSDIDGRQFRGKSIREFAVRDGPREGKRDLEKMKRNDKKSLQSNIEQYGLSGRVIDTVVCDIKHHPWKQTEYWDAIVCDPPYGVRAGAKKIGSLASPNQNTVNIHKLNGELKYPETIPYEMDELVTDLLEFSAVHLVPGGRLVYWLPTVTEEYTPKDIPTHPRMKVIANSEQVFGKWTRRLITMQKLGVGEVDDLGDEENSSSAHEPAHSRFRRVYFKPKQHVE